MKAEIVITFLIAVILSFVLFIALGLLNYKDYYKKKFNFLGNFPFEMHDKIEMKINNYVRATFLIFCLSSIFFQFSIFSLVNIISHTISIIIGSLSALAIIALLFINLNNINLHVLGVTLAMSMSILSYLGLINFAIQTPLFIENKILLYILCGVFVVVEFSLIFFPQMKTWMNFEKITNEDGTLSYSRGKNNFLAAVEWLIILNHFIYLIISFIFIIPSFLY